MEGVLSESITPLDVENSEAVKLLHERLETEKEKLCNYRVAKLWFQYMEMVDLLRRFIKTERLGDWALHLQCFYDMLPFLAASGHKSLC